MRDEEAHQVRGICDEPAFLESTLTPVGRRLRDPALLFELFEWHHQHGREDWEARIQRLLEGTGDH